MILLQANQVARHFGGETLFQHINLEIKDKSRIALIGRNGAGKSTLLKMLAGEEEPDEGTITRTKNLSFGYLAQHTGLTSQKTVWEEVVSVFESVHAIESQMRELEKLISLESEKGNHADSNNYLEQYAALQQTFLDSNGYGIESEIKSVLHGFRFFESFYDQPVNTLSGGQKTRLALAKLLLEKPDLLILDEPTNHLDIDTLNWLEDYLQGYRGAILIVSHDRYFLDKIVTEVYELSRHQIYHYTGNYSRYLELKAAQQEQEWKAYDKQQAEIAKLEDFIARNLVRASTTKRAQSRRKKLEKMTRLDKPAGDEKSAKFLFQAERQSGRDVLAIEQAAIGYDDTVLSEPVTLHLRKQEAVALIGPNGIGKSTLLKSVTGQIPFLKGAAKLGQNVDIGYYDQEQANLTSRNTVLEELWQEHPTFPEKDIRTVLGAFLFSGEDVKKTIPLLSGGEKARVALAKLSMQKDNLLLLDEPTNHLDLDSKEVLEEALIDYDGTLLFVSHDRYFINRIATSVLELSENGSKLYHGDYDYYLEKKKEEQEVAEMTASKTKAEIPAASSAKRDFQQDKEHQRKKRSLEREIAALEEQLTNIDTHIAELQKQMEQPENLEDHEALTELNNQLTAQMEEQDAVMAEWEEKSLLYEDTY